jgi:hypothetical protein
MGGLTLRQQVAIALCQLLIAIWLGVLYSSAPRWWPGEFLRSLGYLGPAKADDPKHSSISRASVFHQSQFAPEI